MFDQLIKLSWNSSCFANGYDEPDRFIYTYEGDIFTSDGDCDDVKIGQFIAHYVDIAEAMDQGESIFDVFDCHSSSTAEYLEPIFGDNEPYFSDDVECITNGNADGFNLLILDRVEIIPEFRGLSIGLKVLRQMMITFSKGAGIITLKAFPLQFENEKTHERNRAWRTVLSLENFVNDKDLSTQKLKNYYGKLGFISLPESDFMVFPTGIDIPLVDATD